MMKFVLLGDIEFIDGTAYVRKLKHALEVSDWTLNVLDEMGVEYLLPHYYEGRIVFDQYHKEDWHIEEERHQAIQDEYREDELRERAERKEEFGY
jgi:hypothetical protein